MSITQGATSADELRRLANDHLWLHFTNMHGAEPPIIVRGDGCYLEDVHGRRYLDALAGLFSVNLGYGYGEEIGQAALEQMRELPFYTNWTYAHPRAIELASEVASLAPGDLNRVFFVSGGSEAVESAWKLARQYHAARGERRWKAVSRRVAYHGTTMGALSITGLPTIKQEFEPLVPGTFRVPNTNYYRRPDESMTEEQFGVWAADRIAEAIEFEGPETVACVYLEPVQNSGGCFPPPPGYFQRVREICDQYDVLLVSDEVICAFGRLGTMFACDKFDYVPDMITCAKGMTSGYSPIGACVISDRLAEPFYRGDNMFLHGYTFGGHPVSAAVALANLDIFEREGLNQHVLDHEGDFFDTLKKLHDLPIVGDVRGNGFFYGIELVKDKATKETFTDEETERVLYGFLSKALYDNGLYCRADDRGDPVVQLAPPLISDQALFDEIEGILRTVLTEAWTKL